MLRSGHGNKEVTGVLRGSFGSKYFQLKNIFLIPPHPLINFEIKKYYQNEPRFHGVYSRDNLPQRIKDGAYIINLDKYADVCAHKIALYNSNIEIIYLDNFEAEHVPNEIIKFIGHKNIKANTFRIQAKKSILCGHFCIGFIDLMFAGKTLTIVVSFLLMILKNKMII